MAKILHGSYTPDYAQGYFKNLDSISSMLEDQFPFFYSRIAMPLAILENEKSEPVGFLMREFRKGCFYTQNRLQGKTQALQELKLFLNSRSERRKFNTPKLSSRQTIALVGDFLNTLNSLHNRNFVVGDVSASNLIVQIDPEKPNKPRMIFLDVDSFSLSTSDFQPAGVDTPLYVVPEHQVQPNLRPTFQSDVYKAALVIVRLLSQSSGFEGHSFDLVETEHSNEFLSARGAGFVVEILEQCLSDNPENRPPIAFLAKAWKECFA